jgi:transcriptional regulator with XRE-family HTH domain
MSRVPEDRKNPFVLGIRHFFGITQQELADEIRVSVRTVRRWENRERNIPPRGLYQLRKLILHPPLHWVNPSASAAEKSN